jgi:hypothetical protein
MGQQVILGDAAWIALSGPAVSDIGATVRVSGLAEHGGAILASRLEGATVAEPHLVVARIQDLDGRHVAVGGVHVEFPEAWPMPELAIGQEFAVRGRWDGEALEADAVVVAPRHSLGPDSASVEGYLHTCSESAELGLDGLLLSFDRDLPPDTWLGRRVVVEGHLRADGVFAVTGIAPSAYGGAAAGVDAPARCVTYRPTAP